MTLKQHSQEIADLSMRFLAHKGDSPNEVIRVYRRKLIVYGDNYMLYVYRRPKVIFSTPKKSKPKQMNKERDNTSFWRAKRNLIRLIACNADSSSTKPTFWTFTFDPSRCGDVTKLRTANFYFKMFRQQLTRKLGFKPKYIAVPEFQKNGNVHYHVIFFNLPFIVPDNMVYDKNPHLLSRQVYTFAMNDVWIYGYTDVQLLTGVHNISLYLAKYMSKSFDSHTGNKTYGEKLYFSSRDLKRPEEYYNEIEISHILNEQKLKIESQAKYLFRGLKVIHMTKKLENKS